MTTPHRSSKTPFLELMHAVFSASRTDLLTGEESTSFPKAPPFSTHVQVATGLERALDTSIGGELVWNIDYASGVALGTWRSL